MKKRTGLSSSKNIKELEEASKECSHSIAASQDLLGVNRYCSMMLCQWTGKDKVRPTISQLPSWQVSSLGIWAGLKELCEQGPLILLNVVQIVGLQIKTEACKPVCSVCP